MTEVERIADQMQRAFEREAWHGPALMELLGDVDAPTAAAHPVNRAHSIWELVHHLTAWKRAIPRRMRGEAVELHGEDDWPPVEDFSEAAWKRALENLKSAHRELYQATLALPAARLSDPVPNRPHNLRFMLHGMVQHDLYHAGQIALLKKASSTERW
ncbi:MAG TPA: DinB family protein [Terriglobales bacterium]|nr:DinB family protein [Terriglobales bacterium]